MAAALTGQAAQDEHTSAIADAVAADRVQLDELAVLYANKQIAAREWMSARTPIEARMTDNERRLSRMTRMDPLAGIVGHGTALHVQWPELNLTRQAAIVKAILAHGVVAPADPHNNRFDPNRVDLVWRL